MSKLYVPQAPAFLDPLTEIDSSYFYAVPRFNDIHHPNTKWLTTVMRTDGLDKIRRKIEIQPELFRHCYFQMLDCPQLYGSVDPSASSLFHRRAVLYVDIIGMALYLKNASVVTLLLEYRNPTGEALYDINAPQYATHVQDTINGDFHAYHLSVIMIRGGMYECAGQLLKAQWNPLEPMAMPMRRRFERRAFYYLDWLDYALSLLHDRPLLPLSGLVLNMTADPSTTKQQRLPMETIKPAEKNTNRVITGLIDVDQLPREARMMGVKSVLDIAEDYSKYLQNMEQYVLIQECIKEMRTAGINPEIMMAHAFDYDGYAGDEDADKGNGANANNNAAKAGKKKDANTGPYISEPTRILLHALESGPGGKSLHACLDCVVAYIKRNFYLVHKAAGGKNSKEKPKDKQAREAMLALQMRDIRNSIALLLNMVMRQHDTMEKLNREIKMPSRFKHIDTSKRANNKRKIVVKNLKRLVGILFLVLLHSGELLDFFELDYPPYPAESIDFQIDATLAHRLRDIKQEMMSELNACNTAYSYMSNDMLLRAMDIKEIVLAIRVGKPPPVDPEAPRKNNKNNNRPSAGTTNANSSTAATTEADQLCNSHHQQQYMSGESLERRNRKQHVVSFVRVKPKPRPKQQQQQQHRQKQQEDQQQQEEETTDNQQEVVTTEDGGGGDESQTRRAEGTIAATLMEQIARLRSSPQGSDVAMSEIFSRIIEDLNRAVTTTASTAATSAAAEEDRQQILDTNDDGKSPGEQLGEECSKEANYDADVADDGADDDAEAEDPTAACAGGESTDTSLTSKRGEASVAAAAGTGGGTGGGKCRKRRQRAAGVMKCRQGRLRCGGGAGGSVGGSGVGGGGKGKRHYQKARVYDARPEGTEFDMDSKV